MTNVTNSSILFTAEKYGGGKLVGQAAGMLGMGSHGSSGAGASNYGGNTGAGAYGPGPNTGGYGGSGTGMLSLKLY